MKYFNIIFELIILFDVSIQMNLVKREQHIPVIVMGIIAILAEIIYILFVATMIESVINMIFIAMEGSLISRELLLKSR